MSTKLWKYNLGWDSLCVNCSNQGIRVYTVALVDIELIADN